MDNMSTASQFIEGRFLHELKNRFLCEVLVNGVTSVCYVPSSCHLGNFLQLKGKRVLLVENQGKKTRTRFALYAFPYKRSYILLSPSIANRAIASSLASRRFHFLGSRKCFFSERMVDGYKADLYIQDTDTIIEVKAVIALGDEAVFPTLYSERTIKQLRSLKERLRQGKRASILIVSLNPYTKRIRINEGSEFALMLSQCIKLGLQIKAFSCRMNQPQDVVIAKSLPIISFSCDT